MWDEYLRCAANEKIKLRSLFTNEKEKKLELTRKPSFVSPQVPKEKNGTAPTSPPPRDPESQITPTKRTPNLPNPSPLRQLQSQSQKFLLLLFPSL